MDYVPKSKPGTMKEVTDQIFFGMYGVNGSPGLIHRMADMEEKFDDHINKKPPKRLERIAAVVGLMVALQTLGLLDAVRGFLWVALTGRAPDPPPAVEQRINEGELAEMREAG